MAGEELVPLLGKEVNSKLRAMLGVGRNFKQDLEDIKSTLCSVQAVLEDFKLSMNDESEHLWLKKLKDAVYDAEDMLLNDFVARKKTKVRMARRFFSVSHLLTSRDPMAHKMKMVVKRLQTIVEERRSLKVETTAYKQEEIKNRETFSYVEATQVLGREKEKDEIIRMMLAAANGNTEVAVISIVGLEGLGKTTLAKLIFNDDRTSVFNLKVWLHAMEFDVKTLARDIISIETGERCDLDDFDAISKCIKNVLRNKRYLIVLDDVWNQVEDKWNSLKLMLQGGNSGSIILVTTCNQDVAWMMGPGIIHDLKYLSDDDCRTLFEQRAFQPGGVERRPILLQIGQEIVKKCGGVPLAAKVLGGMLRTERGEEAWKDARDKIWGIEQHEDGQQFENQILASLKVSYQYMPSPIKLCFLYCSIFPKTSELDKDKLIQQWIALGFIQSKQESKSFEIGEDYVNYLQSMSFLQDKKVHEKTRRITYKMHDLVYDLAKSISGNEVLAIAAREKTASNVGECRYASLNGYEDPSELQKALPKKARALHLQGCLLFSLPDDAFLETSCIRVLDLSGCFLHELPTSISELKQLRYLDASHHSIQTLDAIVKLPNLEMLNLSGWLINELPHTIGALQKLYVLNISGCLNISSLPPSIGDLHRLLYLDLSSCCQLRELPESIWNLKKLCSLNLGGCSSLQSLHESIRNLESLKLLDLSSCSGLGELPESIGNLQNLHTLVLCSCNFSVLPEGLSNLTNLETLDLQNCSSLNHMSRGIGRLAKLRELAKLIVDDTLVEGSRGNRKRSSGCNIAELEHLKLLTGDLEILFKCEVDPEDAQRANLKEKKINALTLDWSSDKQSGDYKAILENLVPHQNLKILKIKRFLGFSCPEWMVTDMHKFLPNLVEIQLSGMLNCDCVPALAQLPYLRRVVLRSMPRIKSISTTNLCRYESDSATSFPSFPSLEELFLKDMPNLEILVMVDDNNHISSKTGSCYVFPCLKKLYIYNCPSLQVQPCIPPSVVHLTLSCHDEALLQSAEVKSWLEEDPTHQLFYG